MNRCSEVANGDSKIGNDLAANYISCLGSCDEGRQPQVSGRNRGEWWGCKVRRYHSRVQAL